MALEPKTTQLALDGRWGLEELSDTTKDYIQLYGFAYSLLPDLPTSRREEVDYIYGKFPWRGGYSTVNFFNQLFHKIPSKLRPEVRRIQYASPGFNDAPCSKLQGITEHSLEDLSETELNPVASYGESQVELSELLVVSFIVAAIVANVCKSLKSVHDLYRSIQKASVDHKLSKINLAREDLDLKQRQISFCETSAKSLVRALGLTDAQEELIDQKVQGNSVMKLKILLSVFRRVEPLAKKQAEGKLKVTGKEHHPR